ncbi:hypothetical protein AVP_134 [Aerococcus phage vB_AviM_AVP]|nr:hypothetical protein AVP_134 [Aerococcus phage vB_AviM_AVP]
MAKKDFNYVDDNELEFALFRDDLIDIRDRKGKYLGYAYVDFDKQNNCIFIGKNGDILTWKELKKRKYKIYTHGYYNAERNRNFNPNELIVFK